MTDIHAINFCLQEHLEQKWLAEISEAKAATLLHKAGLLRSQKNRLPLRDLLRAGRIAGQVKIPNRPKGRWFIRRIASSPDVNGICRARMQMERWLPINRETLPDDWPLCHCEPEFWEALGRAIAALGCLEEELATACYSLSRSKGFPEIDLPADKKMLAEWIAALRPPWTDSLHALTEKVQKHLKEESRVPHNVLTDLVKQLHELRHWRNALCHGAWHGSNRDGAGVLAHYYKSPGIIERFPSRVTTADLVKVRIHAVDASIRLAEVASIAGGGSSLSALPRIRPRRNGAPEG